MPTFADQCPRCGLDPDLRLIELGPRATRRRAGADAPRGRSPGVGGRSWLPLLVVAAVAALLVVVGSGSGDDPPEAAPPTTSTTRASVTRFRDPTTTTAPAPAGPMLDEPVGLQVAVVGSGGMVLDLDTGERWNVTRPILGALRGRLLVGTEGGLAWWPRPYDGAGAEPIDVPFDAQFMGMQAWIDPVSGVVWVPGLATVPGIIEVAPDGSAPRPVTLPGSAWPVGTIEQGLVLDAPGGTYVLRPGGAVNRISLASPFAAAGDRVFVLACTAQLRCEAQVMDADGTVVGVLGELPPEPLNVMVAVSARGQVATVDFDGTSDLVVDGVAVPLGDALGIQSMAWSPDGRWLFLTSGVDLLAFDVETGTVRDLERAPYFRGSLLAFARE